MNAIMNPGVYKMRVISLLSEPISFSILDLLHCISNFVVTVVSLNY